MGSLNHLTPKFLGALGPNNVLEKHLAPFPDQLLVFLTLSLKNEEYIAGFKIKMSKKVFFHYSEPNSFAAQSGKSFMRAAHFVGSLQVLILSKSGDNQAHHHSELFHRIWPMTNKRIK